MLVNIREDPSERRDVAFRYPDKLWELREAVKVWGKGVDAEKPTYQVL